ncbi:hypothetical protein ACFQ1L_35400 [Phytohabitans flavus]|uniref:hypothetical protein n=1 Tax=Phytohabitans flavus TaxID=1076124 RepID=UPI001566D54E|nr:hypothetical protein [Phytohabitans flavus]
MANPPHAAPEVPTVEGYRNFPGSPPGFDSVPPPVGSGPALPGDAIVVVGEAVQRAVSLIAAAAEMATEAGARIQNHLDLSVPAPWGDDPAMGKPFEAAFAVPRAALIESAHLLPEILHDLADDLREALTGFADAEHTSRQLAAFIPPA